VDRDRICFTSLFLNENAVVWMGTVARFALDIRVALDIPLIIITTNSHYSFNRLSALF